MSFREGSYTVDALTEVPSCDEAFVLYESSQCFVDPAFSCVKSLMSHNE